MRGKYASCLRTANCCQRGLKELKSSGEWKRWLAYKFRDLIAILPRPGHRRDKAQTPGTVPAIPGRLATMDFGKNAAFESYGVKQSEGANMQISTGLPRPALRTLEAPEIVTQGEYRLPRAI